MLLWSYGKFEANNFCAPCSSLLCFSFFASPALHCVAFLSLFLTPVHWELCSYYKENGTFCTGKWSFLLIPHSNNRMASVSSAFVVLPRPEQQNAFSKPSDRQPTEGRTPRDEEQEEQSQLSDGEHGRAGLESWWRTAGERKSFSSWSISENHPWFVLHSKGLQRCHVKELLWDSLGNTVQLSEGPVWIAWFFKFIIYSQM